MAASSGHGTPQVVLESANQAASKSSRLSLPVLASDEPSYPPTASAVDPKPPLYARESVRLACICWTLAQAGWSDATAGPLLPTMQREFSASYIVVSLLFISNFLGFFSSGLVNPYFSGHVAFGLNMVGAAAIHLFGFILQLVAGRVTSFGLFVSSFALVGFGSGLQDAQANGWVAGLPSAATKLGYVHAAYGLGALLSPLAATGFVTRDEELWYILYAVSAGIGLVNVLALSWTFRLRPVSNDPDAQQSATLAQVLRMPVVWLFCAFYICYVGLEVTVGGWTVSYLIDVRNAPASAGYVSSGFFGGITLGRLVLIPVTARLGERPTIFIYSTLGIAFTLVTWLVPSFIAAGVSVSLLGLLLGPIYPVGISVATKLLPRSTHTAAVGTMAVAGQAGSALLPFATGALAQRYGVSVLQPVCLALLIAMIGLWTLVPAVARRTE